MLGKKTPSRPGCRLVFELSQVSHVFLLPTPLAKTHPGLDVHYWGLNLGIQVLQTYEIDSVQVSQAGLAFIFQYKKSPCLTLVFITGLHPRPLQIDFLFEARHRQSEQGSEWLLNLYFRQHLWDLVRKCKLIWGIS